MIKLPADTKRARFTSQFYITLQIALIMSTLYKEITGGLNTLHKVYWTITLPPLLTAISGVSQNNNYLPIVIQTVDSMASGELLFQ